MRVLLVAHVPLWVLAMPERPGRKARDLVVDPDTTLFVSSVTIAEIAVKYALGTRDAPPFSVADAIDACAQAGYTFLDLQARHPAVVETLPDLHEDQFDGLLIAQALYEPLRIVTHDTRMAAYDNSVTGV